MTGAAPLEDDWQQREQLHLAAADGDIATVGALLAARANINAHDAARVGETPFGHVINSCDARTARFLMEHGADPAIPGWMQLTALDRAARRHDAAGTEVLRILQGAA